MAKVMKQMMDSVMHPSEVRAMFKVKFGSVVKKVHKEPLTELATKLDAREFCYAVLNKVSRSFAVVIQQLPEELKDVVCIFYLVLRGLDSVEDDMTLELNRKVKILKEFYTYLEIDGWHVDEERDGRIGDGPDYQILLLNFEKVIEIYKELKPEYRAVISDITKRMGDGMAECAKAPTEASGTKDVEQYNKYCHYVAGLVGIGLTELFAVSGLEPHMAADRGKITGETGLANSMGLFLQKTNIIRDYREDLDEGRTWWPESIWSRYGSTLGDFAKAPTALKSLACLNHMVADALALVPEVLTYLETIKDPKDFQFCAIPQVMAIATLAEVYNNSRVFTSVVKVRKGLSCRMMLESNDMENVRRWFRYFVAKIEQRVPNEDPHAEHTLDLCQKIRLMCVSKAPVDGQQNSTLRIVSLIAWLSFLYAVFYLMHRYQERHLDVRIYGPSPLRLNIQDFTAMFGGFIGLGYILGLFGAHFV